MLIDTHSHLHFKSYDTDRSEVHLRMAEFVVKTITVGTAMNTSRAAVGYAESHDDTWAAVGYHPDHVTSDHEDEDEAGALAEPYDPQELEKMAGSSARVLALGETGLDFHYFDTIEPKPSPADVHHMKSDQLRVFNEHADIAARLGKSLIIHSRDAGDDMLRALQNIRSRHATLRMVMHAFNGPWREAEALLDLGCWLGIGGIVTFKPRKGVEPEDTLEAIVQKIPIDRILLETDAPWLAPVPVRGQRNEPSHVRHVAERIAHLKGKEYAEICAITTKNATECFKCSW